jgi:hypothetical protein
VSPLAQTLLTAVLVAAAALYLGRLAWSAVRRLRPATKSGGGCGTGGCGCSPD